MLLALGRPAEVVIGRPETELVMGRPEATAEAVPLPKLYWGMAEDMPAKARTAAAEMVLKEGILIVGFGGGGLGDWWSGWY